MLSLWYIIVRTVQYESFKNKYYKKQQQQHLIPHTLVKVKIEKFIFALPRPWLLPEGPILRIFSDSESSLGIQNPIFDTQHLGKDQNI